MSTVARDRALMELAARCEEGGSMPAATLLRLVKQGALRLDAATIDSVEGEVAKSRLSGDECVLVHDCLAELAREGTGAEGALALWRGGCVRCALYQVGSHEARRCEAHPLAVHAEARGQR